LNWIVIEIQSICSAQTPHFSLGRVKMQLVQNDNAVFIVYVCLCLRRKGLEAFIFKLDTRANKVQIHRKEDCIEVKPTDG
jgi:hypothetical protein